MGNIIFSKIYTSVQNVSYAHQGGSYFIKILQI